MKKVISMILALLLLGSMGVNAYVPGEVDCAFNATHEAWSYPERLNLPDADGNTITGYICEKCYKDYWCSTCNCLVLEGQSHNNPSCSDYKPPAPSAPPETEVTYHGAGTEQYTVTLPAKLAPGADGTVSVSGTWPKEKMLTVTCNQETVTLTNSLNSAETKNLAVTFPGITKAGSNTAAIKTTDTGASAAISVSSISNALFGTWTGTVTFEVKCEGKTYELDLSGVVDVDNGGCYIKADGTASADDYDFYYKTISGWKNAAGESLQEAPKLNVEKFVTFSFKEDSVFKNLYDCEVVTNERTFAKIQITGDAPSFSADINHGPVRG